MRTLHAALWWGSPPFKNRLLFLSPAGPGKLGLARPPRGSHGRGHGTESRGCRASPGEMGAEAPSARGEARGGGQEASQPRRRQEGPKLEGWRGNWRPTNWLPAKPRELLGKSWDRLKCQGHRSRRTAGVEMWVTAAEAPGMLGGALAGAPPHPHPQDAPPPPWGGKRLLGRQGPRVPHPHLQAVRARAGDHPAQPSRWLGWRPAGPSPAPQPDTGESGTASSVFPEEARARQLSRPASPPQAACKAGGGLTP